MSIETVLVANRGEIARRVLATCRRRGLRTVAVHSTIDAEAMHVRDADVTVELAGEPLAAYLDVAAIVGAAVDTGADAIHPGYGFLSENPALARACADAGITFVGPSADVIAVLGDKAAAKTVADEAGVPVLRSIDPAGMDDERLRAAVADLGLPVLVKPVAGGGGKGMRRVDELDALPDAVVAAARESAAAFGDDRLLIERLLTAPRHVEVQVAGDSRGGAVHLFERDCSVQRRHQKVVEEAPSPALDPALREKMGAAAVALVERTGYVNLGTVEFLLDTTGDGDEFYFLEMNTRLQVEHPVTELVTGLDLVGCQLDIAAGGTVPTRPERPDGHAIEVRLYAEDPAADFLPVAGTLDRFTIGSGVRVDSGVEPGSVVSPYYDPMLAKVVAHGADRDQARARLVAALGDSRVTGVVTNLQHLLSILRHPAFASGDVTTSFLTDHLPDWEPPALDDTEQAAVAAALAATADTQVAAGTDPWTTLGPWRLRGSGGWPVRLGDAGTQPWVVTTRPGGWTVEHDGDRLEVDHVAGPSGDGMVVVAVDHTEHRLVADRSGDRVWVSRPSTGSQRLDAPRPVRHLDAAAVTGTATLTAPMPGQVIDVAVAEGDVVPAGTLLVVVEAMKMEHPIVAPGDGVVTDVQVTTGDAVAADQVLVGFRLDEDVDVDPTADTEDHDAAP